VIFGRLNKKGAPADMLKDMKDNVITEKKYNELSEDEKADKIPRGIFVEEQVPEFTATYTDLVQSLQKPKDE